MLARTQTRTEPPQSGLLNDEALLEALFPDEASRPSLRWLRKMRQRRLIPFYRIAGQRMVRFDPGEVRAALETQFKVEARHL
jgi:hypothetical protein